MGQWWNQRGNQKLAQDKWTWKHKFPKSKESSKSSSKSEVYSNIGLFQEMRKISNEQSKLPSEEILKEQSLKSAEGRK